MVTSFSGGGSRSTQREPSTLGKQLVNIHDEVPDLHQDLMRSKDDIKQIREEVCVNRDLINDIDSRRGPGGSMS
jgi:hypothetical protein